jgi:integrase
MRPWTLTRKLERILKRAGLPNIRFHDLHHATLKGRSSQVRPRVLGHATISITLGKYCHVIPAMGDQTRKAMEDDLS